MRRSKGELPPLLEKLTYGLVVGLALYLLFVLWWGLLPLFMGAVERVFHKGGIPETHGLKSSGTGDAVGSVPPLRLSRTGTLRQGPGPAPQGDEKR